MTIVRINDRINGNVPNDFMTRRIHTSFAGRIEIYTYPTSDDSTDVVINGNGFYLSIPLTQITSLTGETIR